MVHGPHFPYAHLTPGRARLPRRCDGRISGGGATATARLIHSTQQERAGSTHSPEQERAARASRASGRRRWAGTKPTEIRKERRRSRGKDPRLGGGRIRPRVVAPQLRASFTILLESTPRRASSPKSVHGRHEQRAPHCGRDTGHRVVHPGKTDEEARPSRGVSAAWWEFGFGFGDERHEPVPCSHAPPAVATLRVPGAQEKEERQGAISWVLLHLSPAPHASSRTPAPPAATLPVHGVPKEKEAEGQGGPRRAAAPPMLRVCACRVLPRKPSACGTTRPVPRPRSHPWTCLPFGERRARGGARTRAQREDWAEGAIVSSKEPGEDADEGAWGAVGVRRRGVGIGAFVRVPGHVFPSPSAEGGTRARERLGRRNEGNCDTKGPRKQKSRPAHKAIEVRMVILIAIVVCVSVRPTRPQRIECEGTRARPRYNTSESTGEHANAKGSFLAVKGRPVVHVQAHGHESAQVREADEQTQSEVKSKSNPCGGRRHAESRANEVEDRGKRSGTYQLDLPAFTPRTSTTLTSRQREDDEKPCPKGRACWERRKGGDGRCRGISDPGAALRTCKAERVAMRRNETSMQLRKGRLQSSAEGLDNPHPRAHHPHVRRQQMEGARCTAVGLSQRDAYNLQPRDCHPRYWVIDSREGARAMDLDARCIIEKQKQYIGRSKTLKPESEKREKRGK
ncbi:hypothetical protein B0H13DRAFT_1916464 [Mycena leptocephala]|nr:hypothetical protein B0H13DRAFT_1916464 [Mycena leptocephala]